MWRLFYPLGYFRLINNEKRLIDFWPTLMIALLITLPFASIKGSSFFEPNGFLDKLLTLTSCLTGFYVAALVAAATFTHPDLDKTVRSGSIALVTRNEDGQRVQEALSRREFACYIFGYLSYLSLALSIFCALAISLSGSKISNILSTPFFTLQIPHMVPVIGRNVLVFSFSVLVAHLFVATSLGLYYLMDRLYRKDRIITSKKSTSRDTNAA